MRSEPTRSAEGLADPEGERRRDAQQRSLRAHTDHYIRHHCDAIDHDAADLSPGERPYFLRSIEQQARKRAEAAEERNEREGIPD